MFGLTACTLLSPNTLVSSQTAGVSINHLTCRSTIFIIIQAPHTLGNAQDFSLVAKGWVGAAEANIWVWSIWRPLSFVWFHGHRLTVPMSTDWPAEPSQTLATSWLLIPPSDLTPIPATSWSLTLTVSWCLDQSTKCTHLWVPRQCHTQL